jgi:hypothetical protein
LLILAATDAQQSAAQPGGILDLLTRPHVSWSCSFVLVLLIVCIVKKQRPSLPTLIEVSTYGAAVLGASRLFWHGAQMKSDEGLGTAAIVGAVVLAVAAIYGFVDALKKIGT